MVAFNYISAIAFSIIWVIGFFTNFIGPLIHILLLAAFALILINIFFSENKSDTKNKQLTN